VTLVKEPWPAPRRRSISAQIPWHHCALYFLLADMNERLHLLKYGLAVILVFVGAKMLLAYWFHLPVWISLSIVAAVTASLLTSRPGRAKAVRS